LRDFGKLQRNKDIIVLGDISVLKMLSFTEVKETSPRNKPTEGQNNFFRNKRAAAATRT